MIKLPTSFKPVNTVFESDKIPVGAYVCKILRAEIEPNQYGDKLKLTFDVAEGEFKDCYRKDWDNAANTQYQKWRGTMRIKIPVEGNQYFDIQMRIFNGFAWNLEQSNAGYRFDGDETKLKGKLVGVVIRDREYMTDSGIKGFWREPYTTRTVADVRDGKVKAPAPRMLPNSTTSTIPATTPAQFTEVEDNDLPF